MYQPQQMELERETRSFAGVAQLAPEITEAPFCQPLHAPNTYLLSLFSELSRYREG